MIGNVIQKGSTIYIYDEYNHVTGTIPVGKNSNDGLKSFTGEFVNVQKNGILYSYNGRGSVLATRSIN